MEVPIQLQQITSCTLMSSAVAYLCHIKGCMKVFHWVNYIHLYFRLYTLDLGLGILQMPDMPYQKIRVKTL